LSDARAVLQAPPVAEALAELDDVGALVRLHDGDPRLFGEVPDVIRVVETRLGWLDVTDDATARVEELRIFVDSLRADGIHRIVLAGMGGSSLAPEVFTRVFGAEVAGVALDVLDSTHPDAVRAALGGDLASTVVLVSSKSGTTEEPRAFAAYAASVLPSPAQLAAVTDPDSELEALAKRDGWRELFLGDPDIGGRYSALSSFGMVPAAAIGVDVARIWERAGAVLDAAGAGAEYKPEQGVTLDAPAATVLAAFIGGLARSGRDKLTILPAAGLEAFGDWAEQLVAESLGKQGTGVIAVVGEPAGPPEAYGDDRAFVELRLAGQRAEGADALERAGQPVFSLDLTDRYDLGGQFLLWELAVALVGVLLDVNPFDEPNVAESKANTKAILDEVAGGKELPPPEMGDLGRLLASVVPGDYVSLQAYLPPTAEVHEQLRHLQGLIRDRLGVAVTAGIGPRFLHSTGQLHKGGPASVVALQIVDATLWAEDVEELPIPGRPYDFGTLHRAQAVGDLRSLRDHDRRCEQTAVEGAAGLADLIGRVRAALG